MPHRQLADDPESSPSPLRGLLIGVPLAIAFWVAVVALARFFV